jgi:hypothetical protein
MKIKAKTLKTSSTESIHAIRNGIISIIRKHEVKYKNFVGFPIRIFK